MVMMFVVVVAIGSVWPMLVLAEKT